MFPQRFTVLPELIIARFADERASDVSGLMFATRAILSKSASAVQGLVSGFVLERANFVPATDHQAPEALRALFHLTISLPMLFFVLAGLIGFLLGDSDAQPPAKDGAFEVAADADAGASPTLAERKGQSTRPRQRKQGSQSQSQSQQSS